MRGRWPVVTFTVIALNTLVFFVYGRSDPRPLQSRPRGHENGIVVRQAGSESLTRMSYING
jgi:hypothetical protein